MGAEPASVLGRLLAADVLSPVDVVDSGVRTAVASRSNEVAVVSVDGLRTFVAKTGRIDASDWEQGDPALERAILPTLAGGVTVRPELPTVVAVVDDLLVTGFVGDGISVSDGVRDGRLSSAAAAHLVGTALGRVLSYDVAGLTLPASSPWGLRLLGPPPRFVAEHPPAAQLHAEVSSEAFSASMVRAEQSWTPGGLVHGDLRWDNCLVDGSGQRVVLVDWECAGRGDPAWDLGCAVAEHLAWGPLGPTMSPNLAADVSAVTLAAVSAVSDDVAALGTSYVRVGGQRAKAALSRAPRFAAARLLHIGFQWTFWDPENGGERARLLCAVAEAVLNDPECLAQPLENGRHP